MLGYLLSSVGDWLSWKLWCLALPHLPWFRSWPVWSFWCVVTGPRGSLVLRIDPHPALVFPHACGLPAMLLNSCFLPFSLVLFRFQNCLFSLMFFNCFGPASTVRSYCDFSPFHFPGFLTRIFFSRLMSQNRSINSASILFFFDRFSFNNGTHPQV